MNFQNVTFVTSAVNADGYPESDLPEIMIWGKSNVGKSLFINALTGVNGISKVSSKPGKTRTINFFNVDNTFGLVDIPGYGYANVSKTMQAKFLSFIIKYTRVRLNLRLVMFLLDSRHKPTEKDIKHLNLLLKHNNINIIIATKWDKLNQKTKNQCFKNFKEILNLDKDDFIKTSSKKKTNFDLIRNLIKENLNI